FFLGHLQHSQLIARIGYESVEDPGITSLKGLVWSAGAVFRPLNIGFIRVEYGSRYLKPTWNGAFAFSITPKLYFTGSYVRTLETEQARLRRTLTDLTDQLGDFPIDAPIKPNIVSLDLINGTFLSDDLTFGLAWQLKAAQGWEAPRSDDPPSRIGTHFEL